MGICQLSPQQRVLKKKNESLMILLNKELQDLTIYYFRKPLQETIKNELLPRYMITDIMVQDIHKLHSNINRASISMNRSAIDDTYEQDLKQSCIIMQDEEIQTSNIPQMTNPSKSFKQNLKNNQSLLLQIKILYSSQFDHSVYNSSLRLFLKWIQIFHEHAYGGFLKPLYKKFCESVYKMDRGDFQSIIDQVTVFVDFMIRIYTYVYALKKLNIREDGKLFKHENVYNMIMSYIFRRTKIKIFLREVIRVNFSQQLNKFSKKLAEKQKITMQQLGIPLKFSLISEEQIIEQSSSYYSNQDVLSSLKQKQQDIIGEQQQVKLKQEQQQTKTLNGPYIQCIILVDQLCNKQDTPITKLKHLVKIAKTIIKSIEKHYQERKKQLPQLDSDSLTSIIMYIIIKANNNRLLQQLKIIENFTTTNCLNSISGYYLQSFLAAAEMIIQM